MTVQYLDYNKDGEADSLLVQTQVPNQSAIYIDLYPLKEPSQDSLNLVCYSRFVPERTDDYAWENDRVAFRVFGPTAQKMVEDGVPGGTLTSGIDCWLKRVEYPVINSWYKAYETDPMAYHKDRGEGLDNFHVGASRGCGGIAVKYENSYVSPLNFTSYKTHCTGPLRTSFSLDYAPWSLPNGDEINITKNITLDKGSNLSKIDLDITGTAVVSAGLTLHEKDGVVSADSLAGWVSYWQPHGDGTQLATAIIAAPGSYLGYETVESDETDKSNVYIHLKVTNGKAVYYAGFTWDKSAQFKNRNEWHSYLTKFSQCLAQPLTVTKKE